MPDESQTEAEDISIRFKTNRPTGLIFATSTDNTLDRMELSIADGRLSLEVNLGSGTKVRNTSGLNHCHVFLPILNVIFRGMVWTRDQNIAI
jgi:leucine-rich repeat transmembrane neuronal protein 1/2